MLHTRFANTTSRQRETAWRISEVIWKSIFEFWHDFHNPNFLQINT